MIMKTLGKITTVLLVAAATTFVVVGVRSIPDVKRYLKIRQM
jgi:hypothetical protein